VVSLQKFSSAFASVSEGRGLLVNFLIKFLGSGVRERESDSFKACRLKTYVACQWIPLLVALGGSFSGPCAIVLCREPTIKLLNLWRIFILFPISFFPLERGLNISIYPKLPNLRVPALNPARSHSACTQPGKALCVPALSPARHTPRTCSQPGKARCVYLLSARQGTLTCVISKPYFKTELAQN
jgi:hypothetical protein